MKYEYGYNLKLKDRFLSKIEINKNNCWLWKSHKDYGGYGRFEVKGKAVSAHRTSFELFKSKIPIGLHLDHLCKVRDCVNPDHLEPVTQKENNRRSRLGIKKATHCQRGHAFNEKNTGIQHGKIRFCRLCLKMAGERYRLTSKFRERIKRYRRSEKYRKYQREWHRNKIQTGGTSCHLRISRSRAAVITSN